MIRKITILLTVILMIPSFMILTSCKKSSDPVAAVVPIPTPCVAITNLSGIFSGPAKDPGGAGILTWYTTQNGVTMSGPVTATTTTGVVTFRGTASGILNGTKMTFFISVPVGGMPNALTCSSAATCIVAQVCNNYIGGTYSGENCCTGTYNNGTFALSRQ